MLIWVAVSADTTAETTPTTRGSSKLGFTRNLASVSRMVRPPAPLAISQAYDLDTKLVRTRHLPRANDPPTPKAQPPQNGPTRSAPFAATPTTAPRPQTP